MVKLNYEVIQNCPSYLNAAQDRELDIRGLGVTQIENLALTKDQNDVLDFSDNDIRRLANFPLMKRLSCILLSNNRISSVDFDLPRYIPNLSTLILTNNRLQELADLLPIFGFKNLDHLCLIGNPVTDKNYYREFVIHKCPKLRILDFCKVTQKERALVKKMFKGIEGKKLEKSLGVKLVENNTFEPEEPVAAKKMTKEEIEKIKAAIGQASSLDEIKRLEKLLKVGHVPNE